MRLWPFQATYAPELGALDDPMNVLLECGWSNDYNDMISSPHKATMLILRILFVVWIFPLMGAEVIGSATGFAVASGGYILTNAHVVRGCKFVTAGIEGTASPAKVVAVDSLNDLALLKVDLIFHNLLSIRDGSRLQLGEQVIAFGYPLQGVIYRGSFQLR